MANKEIGVDFYYNMVFMGVSVILLPIYIIYFIGHHAHPEDSKFGSSLFARSMIFLGFLISYLQIFSVQFDVYLTTYGISLQNYWYCLMMIQTAYVFGVAQLLLVFYESNENLPIVSNSSPLIFM